MLKEYLIHSVQAVIAVPMAELAGFITDRMDAVIGDLLANRPEPLLKASNAYFNNLNPMDDSTRMTNLDGFMAFMVDKIEELPLVRRVKGELREVIGLLKLELEKPESNGTLLRVYMTFLETVSELRPYLQQLRLLLNDALNKSR